MMSSVFSGLRARRSCLGFGVWGGGGADAAAADPFCGSGGDPVGVSAGGASDADPGWGDGVSVEQKRRRRGRDWGLERRGRHWEGLEREMKAIDGMVREVSGFSESE